MAYVFNTDLLLNDPDQEEARKEFPNIFFALNNPELRAAFRPFDERANTAKARSRKWGVFAVLLATGALLLAGGEMLFHDLPKGQVRTLAAIGGIAGIASVLIGVFGIMFRERKMRWLADRLATERIRQFHFQSFVFGVNDILKGARDKTAADAFVTNRTAKFSKFEAEVLSTVDDKLKEIVHHDHDEEGLLFEDEQSPAPESDPNLDEYFRAYVLFRFDRQISYCNLILREGEGFWKHAPSQQAKILGGVALACVFGILLLHGLVFFGAIANIAWMKGPLVHVFAIWAAIVALSARTFEEGFQPEREIERMRQYRLALKRIYARFQKAPNVDAKIAAMIDLEKLSYEEMVLFLKGNYEAEFIM